MTTEKLKRIALIFAMEEEALPLISALGLKEDPKFGDSRLPFRHFRGPYRDRFEILLSINGKDPRHQVDNIGTEPAALNAYLTISGFRPDLCINAGTAGGFIKRGGAIGDVYLIDQPCRFHDHRIPIPGFDAYGLGCYPTLEIPGMAEILNLKRGAVSSGNSLDATDVCLELMGRNEASVKEMEATAIAWVAWTMKVPLIVLKAVTDLVDGEHPTQDEFLAHLSLASRKIMEKTLEVLSFLAEHPELWYSAAHEPRHAKPS